MTVTRDILSKKDYGDYRKRVTGSGSAQAVSNWIKRGHLPPDCITEDGKIIVAKADAALAQSLQISVVRDDPEPQQELMPAAAAALPSSGDVERPDEELPLASAKSADKADTTDYKESRATRERAAARKAQIELAALEGQYVETDPLCREEAEVFRTVRNQLLSLPRDMAPDLAIMTDEIEIEAKIRTHIESLLEQLANDIAGSEFIDSEEETSPGDSDGLAAGSEDAGQ
tara:strand:+ start:791 stop:1480 length:690 start_codon:yes stop_codon:yes gene_type:complete